MQPISFRRRLASTILATCAVGALCAITLGSPVSAVTAPTPTWVAPVFNGSGLVAAGSNGSSYVLASITSNTTFGQNSVTIVGTNDAVVVKRLADGSVAWVLQIQESTNAIGVGAIAVDANDNVYIRGSISAVNATFGSISVTGAANSAYLAKINASGVVQWVRLMSSTTHLEAQSLAVHPTSGETYVSGRHRGLTAGTVTVATTATIDAYVVKYDASGSAVWGKSWGGGGTDMAMRVHVQDSSNIIVSGTIQSTSVAGATSVAFDSLPALVPTGTSRSEGVIAKMNASDGSFVWATMTTGTGDDEVLGIRTDSAGNVYATGWFSSPTLTVGSSTLTNAGTNDVWVAKLNSSGQFQWARSGGGSDVDAAFTLVIDSADNIYIGGYFGAYGSTTKNGVFGTTTLVSAGAALGLGDGFIASWSSSGTFRWALSTETATGHGFVGTLGLSDNGDLLAHAGSISGNIVVGSTTTTYAGTSGATLISFASVGNAVTTTTSSSTTSTTTTAPQSSTSTSTTLPSSTSTTLVGSSSTSLPSSGSTGDTSSTGASKTSPSTTISGGMTFISTSTTTPVSTTTTTVAPDAPQVNLGQAGVVVAGEATATTITRTDNSLLVAGGGIEATIYGQSSNGQRINLDENGDLRLVLGDSIVVETKGFESASTVDVWMYSTPTRLGQLKVLETGSGMGTFSLPSTADTGEHRVVLDGANDEGQDIVLGLGIAVGELESSSVNTILIVAPLSLAILFALILPSVLRRRRQESAA